MSTILVPLDAIRDNPFQTRRDYGDVGALAADIVARGLLQPPLGRILFGNGAVIPATGDDRSWGMDWRRLEAEFPANATVELAFGHRRLRAYRQLPGETHMPVRIAPLSDDDMIDALWAENEQRADVNPMEQAELLARKLAVARQRGGNAQTVAEAWNLDRSTVANKIRLLKLPPNVQAAVRDGRVSERQAMAMLSALRQDGELAESVIEATLAEPTAVSSDDIRAVRRHYTPRPKVARLGKSESTPMLRHGIDGGAPEGALSWDAIAAAARAACTQCIRAVGPANESVCRQCPGVALVRTLATGVN